MIICIDIFLPFFQMGKKHICMPEKCSLFMKNLLLLTSETNESLSLWTRRKRNIHCLLPYFWVITKKKSSLLRKCMFRQLNADRRMRKPEKKQPIWKDRKEVKACLILQVSITHVKAEEGKKTCCVTELSVSFPSLIKCKCCLVNNFKTINRAKRNDLFLFDVPTVVQWVKNTCSTL